VEHSHKSGLISSGQVQPGPDMKKTAGFWPGSNTVSGATLISLHTD